MTHRLAPAGGRRSIGAVRKVFRFLVRCPPFWPLAMAASSMAHAEVAVSITAVDDTASESPADSGRFLVRSDRAPSSSLRVEYSVGGSATPGADYERLSGRVNLTPGQPEAFIVVDVPGDDGRFEGDETVVITLRDVEGDDDDDDDDDHDDDDDDKPVGSAATVTIRDSSHSVTIERVSNAGEDRLTEGELRASLGARNESGEPLSIDYSVGGTASPGIDYEALTGLAIIPTGSGSVPIVITPLDDDLREGEETVNVTLTGTSDSRAPIGQPDSASVSISDDDSGNGGGGEDGDGGGDDGGGGDGGGGDDTGGPDGDMDGDGLSNQRESELGTDPESADTDGDGVSDGDEVTAGTDPLDPGSVPDKDGDLVPDAVEAAGGTDPNDPHSYTDSDGGGTADHIETVTYAAIGIAPTNPSDPGDDRRDLDGDGLPDRLEIMTSSAPDDADSPTASGADDDNDNGVTNAVEAHLAILGIVSVDSAGDLDRDGYPNAAEVALGLNPLRASERDGDGDGVPDIIEALAEMDIDSGTDSDGDGVPNAREFSLGSDFLDANLPVANGAMDDDGDGVSNAIEHVLEVLGVSDDVAADTDSDGDGMTDAEEVRLGTDPARDEQPVPWIELKQGGIGAVKALLSDGDPAAATAVIGGHQAGTLLYDWTESDNAVLAVSSGGQTSRTLEFSPRTLPTGAYKLVVQVERRVGDYSSAMSIVEHLLVVLPDAQPADVADADSDGIPDSVDGMDARAGFANELPAQSGNWLQTNPGLKLQLGSTARISGAASARVTQQDLANAGGEDGSATVNGEDEYDYLGGIYDFEVTALSEVGAVAQIVVPQASPIGEFPDYRKHQPGSGWFGFVEDENNAVASAAGSSAGCPPAGDDSYRPGLTAGHFCVQLSIEDGGPNDADAALGPNGVIKDPGGVATPKGQVTVGSGSGRTGPVTVVILGLLVLLGALRKGERLFPFVRKSADSFSRRSW